MPATSPVLPSLSFAGRLAGGVAALLALAGCVPPGDGAAPVPTVSLGVHRPAAPDVPLDAPWGTHLVREDTSPVGPMAILADGDGFAVLDQEALRIRRFDADGSLVADVPLPSRSTFDAVSGPDGGWGLLAYHRLPTPGWDVQALDAAGALLAVDPVDAGETPPSAVLRDSDRLLVELAHDRVVDPRTGATFPGRPDGAGWYVAARKDGPQGLTLTWTRPDPQAGPGEDPMPDVRAVHLHTDRLLSNVVALDPLPGPPAAAAVTLLLYDEGPPPRYEMRGAELRVVVVDRFGHRLDETTLPVGLQTEMARHVAVAPDGTLWRLRTGDERVAVDRLALVVPRETP